MIIADEYCIRGHIMTCRTQNCGVQYMLLSPCDPSDLDAAYRSLETAEGSLDPGSRSQVPTRYCGSCEPILGSNDQSFLVSYTPLRMQTQRGVNRCV